MSQLSFKAGQKKELEVVEKIIEKAKKEIEKCG